MVDVLLPVLGRPDRARPLLESLRASEDAIPLSPYFIVSERDGEEREALDALMADPPAAGVRAASLTVLVVAWRPGRGDYARKINFGCRCTRSPFVFLAADDLHFRHGWADEAVALAESSGCAVIGTDDRGNPDVRRGQHSTHSLVARWYIDECGASADGPGVVLHEGYDHSFVDNELVAVARSRGCYAHCHRAVVEHLHPNWRRTVEWDSTYEKGQRAFNADRVLFTRRRRLWEGRAA